MIQNENPYRNPVILIPGLLGSKLIDPQTGHTVWGKFGVAGITSDKVTVSIVDKTGFSQILVSVSADAEDTKI